MATVEEHLAYIERAKRLVCLHCGLDFKNKKLLDYHFQHTVCGEYEILDKLMEQERLLGSLDTGMHAPG